MVDIEPILFNEVENKEILTKEGYGFEIKENGVRSIIHVKNHKIAAVRGRNNLPVLYLYPELEKEKIGIKEGILDGEICIFEGEKSIYYDGIDQRRSRRSDSEIKKQEEKGRILKLVLFDALKIDNEILINRPYSYRYSKLKEIPETKHIVISKLETDGEKLWETIVAKDFEGIIARNLNGIYQLGKRSTSDWKYKNYKPAELTVTKTEQNDKGVKVWGEVALRNGTIVSDVSCQFANFETIQIGEKLKIKYLDCIETDSGKRLIQPTKLTPIQYEKLAEVKV